MTDEAKKENRDLRREYQDPDRNREADMTNKTKMKGEMRNAYLSGVWFIALNLDIGKGNKWMEKDVSVMTLATAFDVPAAKVVRAIKRVRKAEGREEC